MTDPTAVVALVATGVPDGSDRALRSFLVRAGFALVDRLTPGADVVLVLAPTGVPRELEAPLLAEAGGGPPVLLVGPQPGQVLADTAGLVPGRLLPVHVVRVRPGRDAGEVAVRLGGDELLLTERWPLQDKVADDVEQLLTANSAFSDHPVATWRPATSLGTFTLGSTEQTYGHPVFARLVTRLLRRVLGRVDGPPVRIGMLGYGSHYLDWVLDLLPQPVEWVSATAHKRMWHDVTNADHTRVLLHFADGVEAEFTHSDLAAVRKPKFYVLGTRGGLVGEWQQERVVSRSPVGLVLEDRFAVSDAPAALSLLDAEGSRTALALPAPPAQPFHRELADALLSGLPMSITPEGSRRNIAVMQAATQSAADGGRPVAPPT